MTTVRCSWTILLPRLTLATLFSLFALFGDMAFGADPTIAVDVAQAGEGFIVDATMDVLVPQATAWDVLTDFDHMAAILSNVKASKVTRRDGNIWIVRQEGVARFGLLAFSFESEREMRLEPTKRILAKSLSGTLKRMESETKIAPIDQGIQIKYHAELVPDSALARMFGASFVRHEVEEQFLTMGREMMQRQSRAVSAGKVSG